MLEILRSLSHVITVYAYRYRDAAQGRHRNGIPPAILIEASGQYTVITLILQKFFNF